MVGKTILVCDDDQGILDMMELILDDAGFRVVPEINSLNIYKTIAREQPVLILLDLWMPVLSGDQVLKTLRENPQTKNLPIFIISASRDGKKIAEEAGATAFIAKPFDMDHLLDKIRDYIH